MNTVLQLKPQKRIEFEIVAPQEITLIWDEIVPGLRKAQRYGDRWRPEDIYGALKSGQSTLHVWKDGLRVKAFLITTVLQDFVGTVLHVWIAYADRGHAPRGAMDHGMIYLRGIASHVGAYRIQFWSPRKAWGKMAERLGFKPAQVLYELETRQTS